MTDASLSVVSASATVPATATAALNNSNKSSKSSNKMRNNNNKGKKRTKKKHNAENSAVIAELNKFKEESTAKAEKIIKEYMPIKILQLTKLCDKIEQQNQALSLLTLQQQNLLAIEENGLKNNLLTNNSNTNRNTTNNTNNTNNARGTNTKRNSSETETKTETSTVTIVQQTNSGRGKKRKYNELEQSQNMDIDTDDNSNMENNKHIVCKRKPNTMDMDSNNNNNINDNNDAIAMDVALLTSCVKAEVKQFTNYLDKIKRFILFHTPKIEDGNNFGVEVQQTIKSMIDGGHSSGNAFLRNLPRYYQLRANIECKIIKYPNVCDYRQALFQLDKKQRLALQHCLRDLRNNYWILHDILTKNWIKVIKPKGDRNSTFSMY